jgi:hypothetical protein
MHPLAQDLELVACEALVAAPGSRDAAGEQTTLGRLGVLSKTPGLCHGSEWTCPEATPALEGGDFGVRFDVERTHAGPQA